MTTQTVAITRVRKPYRYSLTANFYTPLAALMLATAVTPNAAAENLGTSSQPLTVDKTITLWTSNSNTVPVCWETAGYDREKKIVKEAIQGTWEFHANLNFTGWGDCPSSGKDKHVRMRIDSYGKENSGAQGRAPVFGTGALSDGDEKRAGIIFQFNPDGTAKQSRVEYVAVHEFGHVLGFMHEQDGPGNVEGSEHCDKTTGSGDNAKPVTEYDRDSVMNYCNKFGNSRGDLSDIDIKGAHDVYGVRRQNLASRNSCSSALMKEPVSLAAPWNDGGSTTIAVFPSDRTKFLYHNQWNVKDGGWADNVKWMAGDYNGDGLSDVAAAWNNGGTAVLTMRQSNGTGFAQSHWLVNAGGWMESSVYLPGDFNGDGKTDVAGIWNNGGQVSIAVFLSDGTKFPGWTQWSDKDGGWADNVKWVAGDFNGDGKTDIGAAWNNGGNTTLTLRRSTGSAFVHEHWLANAGDWTESGTFVAGDFNADGRADIVKLWEDLGQTSSQVYLSDGAKFQNAAAWSTRDGGWGSEVKWTAGDFDGDGYADLNATWNNGGTNVLTVRRSTGSAFSASHWSTNAGGWMDSTAWCSGRFAS